MSHRCGILIVDDDLALAKMCQEMFESRQYRARAVGDAEAALHELEAGDDYCVVLTDLVMPGMDGVELLKQVKERWPRLDVVVMTSYGTINSAVEAMKLGASDYISKPFQPDQLILAVERVLHMQALEQEVERLKQELEAQRQFENIVGDSPPMQRVYSLVESVADTDANVLIQGETGTGKELVAKAIHNRSARRHGPFVKVDCAALSESLLESELFGHVRGAFTGADSRRDGRFRTADGGTLFLDEISNVPLSVQAKLLRVIQDSEFEPVGGDQTVRVDVRVIAASNVALDALVEEGAFRRDLFYRLNVVQIPLPPLRERLDDIPLLVAHFLMKYSAKNRSRAQRVSRAAVNKLMAYDWPGNVRELENMIERAVILCQNDTIGPEDLPLPIDRYAPPGADIPPLKEALRQAERQIILHALEQCDYDKELAAKRLKISRASIYNKIKELNLRDAGKPASPRAQ